MRIESNLEYNVGESRSPDMIRLIYVCIFLSANVSVSLLVLVFFLVGGIKLGTFSSFFLLNHPTNLMSLDFGHNTIPIVMPSIEEKWVFSPNQYLKSMMDSVLWLNPLSCFVA